MLQFLYCLPYKHNIWRDFMRTSKNFSMREFHLLQDAVQQATGYRFQNSDLLKQAFTRRSYTAQFGGENNEILEFLGDQILEYYVVKRIAAQYGHVQTPHSASYDGTSEYVFSFQEDTLSALKSDLVCNHALAQKIDVWRLTQFLIVGKSDFCNHADQEEKVKADLFEAIVGAVAIASNWDTEVLESSVSRMLSLDTLPPPAASSPALPDDCSAGHAVTALKELAEQGRCSIPIYEFSSPNALGGDKAGRPRWSCCISIRDWGVRKVVFAASKKDAKKYAAYLALRHRMDLSNEYAPGADSAVWYPVWTFDGSHLSPTV